MIVALPSAQWTSCNIVMRMWYTHYFYYFIYFNAITTISSEINKGLWVPLEYFWVPGPRYYFRVPETHLESQVPLFWYARISLYEENKIFSYFLMHVAVAFLFCFALFLL